MSPGGSAARSHLYRLLAAAFGFPGQEFYLSLRDGSFGRSLSEVVAALPYPLESQALGRLSSLEDDTYEEFQSEYISHFEVGTAGPPCPLYGGVYLGGRTQVWEELIRFYNHFGLHLSEENRDLPDHLATELEFLHYLSFREASADSEETATSFRRAQRDFLAHHPVRWLGLLGQRAAKREAHPWYRALITFCDEFTRADLAYLGSLAGWETGQSALATDRQV